MPVLGRDVSHLAGLQTGDGFDPATAKAAGGQPEVLAPVPSTVTLSSSSTSSRSPSTVSADPTSTSTGQDNSKTEKPSNVGAIAGGVIGGLAILAAVGVGVWMFLRRRATARIRINGDYPDYPKYTAVASTSEHGIQPSQMRLYVSFFIIVPSLRSNQG